MSEVFSLEDTEPATNESAEIIGAMPEPQQHAINAAGETTGSESGEQADVDGEGNTWNPSIHATGADGKGVKTVKGLWRKKRGQASRVSSVSAGTSSRPEAVQQPQAVADNTQLIAQARAAGAAAAASVFMLGRALGGEDWAPSADEVTMQTEAWSNYFVAKGVYDFPPGLALCIAVTGYAGPRFFTPSTQARASTVKHWVAIRVAKWRVKKALRKLGVDAVVTIKGSQSADVYDSILVNGQPFNALGLKPDGTRIDSRHDVKR